MSHCERVLAAHVDCVKAFLRDCRENEKVYAPGSYSSHDRCQHSRQAYVDCCHDKSADKVAVRNARVPRVEINSQQAVSGEAGAEQLARQWTTSPLACAKELSVHGTCVANYLRSSLAKGTDYIFTSQDAPDKCFITRTNFDQCVVSKRQREEVGADPVTNVRPRGGQSVVRSFSHRGRWIELD